MMDLQQSLKLSYFDIFAPNPPPPPSDGVGWGLHVLVIFSVEFFLFIDFLGSS